MLLVAITVRDLLKMSQVQPDDLFTQSPTGDIPEGEGKGTAIVAPGTTYSMEIAELVDQSFRMARQGKVFDSQKGFLLKSCLLAFAQSSPKYAGTRVGCMEGMYRPYSRLFRDLAFLAHWIRDEIRNISPGIYLRNVYWDNND
jgi:hypothetical protein